MNSRPRVLTRGFSAGLYLVWLGLTPLSQFSSRWNLKSKSQYARLKLVEINSMGRNEFKFTHAVDTNPQVQKMSLVQSNTFSETSTRRLQQILNFLGEYKKTQVVRIRHSTVGSGSKLTRRSCTLVGTRNWAQSWVPWPVHTFPWVQTCGTPVYQ